MKSGNLNFLEPSGPLRACNGTALSLLKILQLKHNTKEEALLQLGGNNGKAKGPKCYVYVHISYLVQRGGTLGLN
jgi:hypothetical protein